MAADCKACARSMNIGRLLSISGLNLVRLQNAFDV